MTHAIDVGRPQRPDPSIAVDRRRSKRELRGRGATLSRLRVAVESLADPCGARVGAEVDPHAVDLDRAAGVPAERPAPSRGERGEAAPPGDDADLGVRKELDENVDPDRAEDPEVLGSSPSPSPGRRRSPRPGGSERSRRAATGRSRPCRTAGPCTRPETSCPSPGWARGPPRARPYASSSTIPSSSSPSARVTYPRRS